MKSTEIRQLLPSVFQRTAEPDTPLGAVLEVMQILHEPDEAMLANIDAVFDPRRADERFLPMLAYWVNLDRLFRPLPADASTSPWGERPLPTAPGHLRELIAAAAYLAQWRGTSAGLIRLLEIATGLTGYEIDESVPGPDGRPLPFHICVHAPASAQPYVEFIERIIEQESPAYVTSELQFAADESSN